MHDPKDDATDLLSLLPDRVWYLTSTGLDMYCRRPYGFFFTTSAAAEQFAVDFGVEDVSAIAVESKDLLSDDGIGAMRRLAVTRVFLDPQLDAATGDVFGQILRFAETH